MGRALTTSAQGQALDVCGKSIKVEVSWTCRFRDFVLGLSGCRPLPGDAPLY